MPQRSRDRHRGYERDRDRTNRERGKREGQRERGGGVDRRRRRRRGADEYEEVDAGDGEESHHEQEEAEEEEGEEGEDTGDVFDDRRHRRYRSSRSRTRERRYDPPHDDDEDDEDNEDHGDDERNRRGGNVIFVDSRPSFAKPPDPRVRPPHENARGTAAGAGAGGNAQADRSGHQHKAKESPATSPIKKRDRDRDRQGRRRRDSTADEGSPTKPGKLRDRKTPKETDQARATRSGGEEREGAEGGKRTKRREQKKKNDKHASADSGNSATQLLNADALARLNARNQKTAAKEEKARVEQERKQKQQKQQQKGSSSIFGGKIRGRSGSAERNKNAGKKKRLVSGAILEEGRSPELRVRGGRRNARNEKWRKRGGGDGDGDGDGNGDSSKWSRKKKIWVALGVLALLLAIVIPVAVVVSKKGEDDGSDPAEPATTTPSNYNLENVDPDSIPSDAKDTYYDPFSWYDTTDFNVTYTEETVGGLPIMGLNSTWDDTARPNDNVPALDESFPYGEQPIRGVNVGGWLCIEPFITPSFFDEYDDDVSDEWMLAKSMGATAKEQFEKHYATFITEQSFKEIRDAGFDHVRIPYGYWAVTTYDDDPYVAQVSFRYLLRAIEYCRKYGLRVSLDLHAAPGSQNGWNHSGRQGTANWLNGTDGDLNGQRTLDIHDQLSQFFAQPRYENVVTMYGLVNEPMMLKLEIEPVLTWTEKATGIVKDNGMDPYIVFGDGFLKLSKWTSVLQDTGYDLVLDTHQYTIFNPELIKLTHQEKLEFVCDEWVDLISDSVDSGFGPTICGEWSQADTDCAKFLNNVGTGARWTGTMNDPNGRTDVVLSPQCPTQADDADSGKPCSCEPATADPSDYSDSYKTFLKTYAEAQISAFETGWGWFYWTWETESAVQWSWKKGLAAGIVPEKAYAPDFKCGDDYPDLGSLPEYY